MRGTSSQVRNVPNETCVRDNSEIPEGHVAFNDPKNARSNLCRCCKIFSKGFRANKFNFFIYFSFFFIFSLRERPPSFDKDHWHLPFFFSRIRYDRNNDLRSMLFIESRLIENVFSRVVLNETLDYLISQ